MQAAIDVHISEYRMINFCRKRWTSPHNHVIWPGGHLTALVIIYIFRFFRGELWIIARYVCQAISLLKKKKSPFVTFDLIILQVPRSSKTHQ